MNEPRPLIDLRHVYKIYNEDQESEVRALEDVSLTVWRGEFAAIVGASGSGKSTLMNILGCLDVPTYGQYLLDGEEVDALSDGKLSQIRNRQIGFIFQGFHLLPALSALENVELPLIYRGIHARERRELAGQALRRVGLAERMGHKPGEMSGGQQQRVAIARAIATRPPVILADEPTGNLDSRTGAHVMELLKTFHEEGSTVILITHDDHVAAAARRRIRILDGRIVLDEREEEAL